MPKKLKSIYDDTPLIPDVVADIVIGELERYLGHELCTRKVLAAFLVKRADHLYLHNETFRKRITSKRGETGRDYLYCFMRHWLSGELYHMPGMREKIPPSFANGLPLPR